MGPRCLLVPLLASACQAAPAGNSGFSSTPGVTSAPTSASDESSPGTSTADVSETTATTLSPGTSTSSDSTTTTPPIFDLGTSADIGDGKPAGCKGKIDFLFVISRNTLMNPFQAQLAAAVPDFLAIIQAKFDDFDYHIMVVDGGDDWGADWCNEHCTKDGCAEYPPYPCDLLGSVTFCDQLMGAGTVFPAGYMASNKPCPIDGDKRYLTRDQTDLAGTFACLAAVGTSGRGWIGEALTKALSHQLTGPGGCNGGFLRKDALLMVTLISDDWDEEGKPLGSAGTPDEWAQAVLDAKGGDAESVVMLSLLDPSCPPQDRTCEMVKKFPYSLVGENMGVSYGPQFDKASDLVEVACAGFSPPG